ncbi:MAG: BatA domain-containing protein, partial [Bacteroidales bacterium]
MFRFENEYYLYGLAIIPLLVALYIYLQIRSKKRMQAYADSKLLEKLMPESSSGMQHLKFSLLMMALTCFIFALANPQIGSSRDKGTRKGVDIMMCLDIS